MEAVAWLAGITAGIAAEAARRRETETIGVTRREVPLPRWPPALDGFQVLVVSDLHVHPRAPAMGRRELKLARLLEETPCDVLLAPGDMTRTRTAARVAVETLRHARPRHGAFLTLGNGENKQPEETLPIVLELQQAGHLLLNDSAFVRAGEHTVWIIGVNDPSQDRDRLDRAARGVPEDAPRLLLAHSPEIVTRLHRVPVDLVVCGHTHGGQVCPPNGQALWTQTQALDRSSLGYGLFGPEDFARYNAHNLQRTRMYVSRGVGTAKLPVRAFCRPEVALLTLRSVSTPAAPPVSLEDAL